MPDQSNHRVRGPRGVGRTLIARLALMLPAVLSPARATLLAQQPIASPRDTAHAQTQAPFFTRKDAYLAAGFAVATAAMFPLDERLAEHIQNHGAQTNRFFQNASKGVTYMTSPGSYLIGGSLYLIGRVGHWDRIADLGWHGTESILFAEGVTFVLKGLIARERPYAAGVTHPFSYHPFRGYTDTKFQSFPSGHSTTAFAAAAAVTNETSRWWPSSTWVVGPILYGGATAVALSRMYNNKHWASDVTLGAAIGTFSGRKVVQYMHGHPGNRLDRIMLHTALVPDGSGGLMLAYHFVP